MAQQRAKKKKLWKKLKEMKKEKVTRTEYMKEKDYKTWCEEKRAELEQEEEERKNIKNEADVRRCINRYRKKEKKQVEK